MLRSVQVFLLLVLAGCSMRSPDMSLPEHVVAGQETWWDVPHDISDTALEAERQYIVAEYHYQLGTEADYAQAAQAYLEAAELGHRQAQYRLGELLVSGKGLQHDPVAAHQWIRRAAKQGVLDAQATLGSMYEFGVGVMADRTEAERWYLLAAKKGDVPAMVGLGRLYYLKSQGDEDLLWEAKEWFERAAALGDPQAHYYLGVLHRNGAGVPQDHEEALGYFLLAAQQGYGDAYIALSELYAEGIQGEGPDLNKATALLEQAALLGEGKALMMKAVRYELGDGVARSLPMAADMYEEAAQKNMPAAAYRLGEMALEGKGRERSLEQAYHWFEQAAQGHYPPAHMRLAELSALKHPMPLEALMHHLHRAAQAQLPKAMYWLSVLHKHPPEGMEQDIPRSLDWFQKASSVSGYAHAQYEIGRMYTFGQGLPHEPEEAFRWYLQSAQRGAREAQVALADAYTRGSGVSINLEEAVYWYKRAALAGAAEAAYALANMYHVGLGVGADPSSAAEWLKIAATSRYRPAQARLASWYHDGVGVPRSDVEAYAWWKVALEPDRYEGPYQPLQATIKAMTPHELSKAQALAEQYERLYAPLA